MNLTLQLNNKWKTHKCRYRWNNFVIKHCIIFHAMCPGAYELLRESGLLLLPSKTTLQNYVGPSTGEVGVTDLIRKRIKLEMDLLEHIQRVCSLKIDGMHLQRSKIYLSTVDKNVGLVDTGGVQLEGVSDKPNNLATDLLAFVVEGKFFLLNLIEKI